MAINIEIPLLLGMFTVALFGTIVVNQVIYLTCYVTLDYNQTECALLGSGIRNHNLTRIEKEVQPHAAIINMSSDFLNSIMGSLICLFLGSWSDKYGRKPVLISSLTGILFGCLVLSAIAAVPHISPWFLLLPSIFTVFGGFASFLSACFSYASDVTTEENRGTRMGLLEATITLGLLLGSLSSSYIFNATSYVTVYLICVLCILIGLLYTIFYIPESITSRDTQTSFCDIFVTSHIKDMFKTFSKRREKYNRAVLFCIVFMLTLFIFMCNDYVLLFLFVRRKLQWSLQKYTFFTSATSVIWIFGTFLCVYILHKKLKVPESVLLLLGFLSFLNGSLLYAFASKDWHMYFGGVVRLLGGGVSPMGRSLISKLVSTEEIGAIFSLIITLETLTGSMSSPLYTYIYNVTIRYDPGAIYFLSAALTMLEIFITIVIILCRSYQRFYNEGTILQESDDDM